MARLHMYRTKHGIKRFRITGSLSKQVRNLLVQHTDVTRIKGAGYTCLADEKVYAIVKNNVPNLDITSAALRWRQSKSASLKVRQQLITQTDVDLGDWATKLHPFQRVGANFLVQARFGLLADSPGLGKTAQAIAAIRASDRHRKVLVICPNALKAWWKQEIAQWYPDIPTQVFVSKNRDFQLRTFKEGVAILNWEMIPIFYALIRHNWEWIICDEAHRLRRHTTKTFAALERLQYTRLALLTATPMANHPAELWPMLSLIAREQFGSYTAFFEKYVNYVISPWGKKKPVGVVNPSELRERLSTVMLQRTWDDVGIQMPEKQLRRIDVTMTTKQRTLYKEVLKYLWIELEDGDIVSADSAALKVLRLRQIISTTATITDYDSSAKLDLLSQLIEDEGPKDQWVVFSEFRATCFSVAQRCAKHGLSCSIVVGGLGYKKIAKRVKDFQDGKTQVFVATTGSGGVGLNLQCAHLLVRIDKWWAPDRQMQSEDRIYRIGQKHNVIVTELFMPNTIDELVEEVLERKIGMEEAIFSGMLRKFMEKYK